MSEPEQTPPETIKQAGTISKTRKPHKTVIGGRQVTLWTDDDRRKAAMLYASLGSYAKTSRECGIPDTTLKEWDSHPDKYEAWHESLANCRASLASEHLLTFNRIVSQSQAKILDRLENGDQSVSNGKVITHEVKARDLAVIADLSMRSSFLLQGKPTSITQSSSRLDAIADRLKSALDAVQTKTIDGEATRIDAVTKPDETYPQV